MCIRDSYCTVDDLDRDMFDERNFLIHLLVRLTKNKDLLLQMI